MSKTEGELGEDLCFFPLTGLQFGKWLSAFHQEKQLFLYTPNKETLVFLALHPHRPGQVDCSFFVPLSRKEILKQFGKHSPFAAPVERQKQQSKWDLRATNFLARLSAEYWGITAFEVNIKDIAGLDYSNTLITYGSRIVVEARKGLKKWFANTYEFCKHYQISQWELSSEYYRPKLSPDRSYFGTRQMYPFDDEKANLQVENSMPGGVKGRPAETFHSTESSDEEYFSVKEKRSSSFDSPDLSYGLSYWHSEFKYRTIVAYFEDPILPYFMKKLVRNPDNTFLLRKYERGIPSWAVFLPSYGLPYRPWMRRAMAFLIFCVSLITMILGFYDLYKNIPRLRESLHMVFGTVFEDFEQAIILRLSFLLGYIFATNELFRNLIAIVFTPLQSLFQIIDFSLNPVKSLLSTLQPLVKVFSLLIRVIYFLATQVKDFVLIFMSLPFDIVWGTGYGIYSLAIESYLAIVSVASAVRNTSNLLQANKKAVEAARTLSVGAKIKDFWQNVFRHVLKGVTSIYNFIVYSSVNLYKYKESTWNTWERYYRENPEKVKLYVYRIISCVLFYAVAKYLYKAYSTQNSLV